MSIKGFFPTGIHPLPAPHVQAFLFIPRLNSSGTVIFMIDTGADNTTLSLIDIERLNINYRRLRPSSLIPVAGLGGDQRCYQEEAAIIFRDDNGATCSFSSKVWIPKKGRTSEEREQQRKLISVIGRDVISHCHFNVDYQKDLVELEPPLTAIHPPPTRRLI